ncbi:hypothetical protein MTES_0251 [Microbacterium testaceum StLB037]|uniref:Uncharacterized protein n=1 Tax=Microbacterium testaceum (strain StLB037) TaxID=979556 RepID=E8N9G8_MICTS|nr:helicase C-terminal domain-containing protein [Microbacterium testaceum]BAJ73215.1 hypothetical protein MTES_0251 [Microbacterium testaceum StLB037]
MAEHLELGYAVTSHRAQGVTVDASHVLAGTSTIRENFYVAMTRGSHANHAYIATDRPDAAHDDIPSSATGRSIIAEILQHTGAQLSAHETIIAEQGNWTGVAQLAAEYETLAAAAQRDRWERLIQASGLTPEEADDAIASPAFGPLTAELRRAEADNHNVQSLLPALVRARAFGDADDIAAVLHHRVARATSRPSGAGRTRNTPRLIAGLIPEATGVIDREMADALTERQALIESRAHALLDAALADGQSWTAHLSRPPEHPQTRKAWRRCLLTVAAYRDRYAITGQLPLGSPAQSDTQRIDAGRASAALGRAQKLADPVRVPADPPIRPAPSRAQPRL